MKPRLSLGATKPATVFATLLLVGTLSTLWFAYGATRAWQHSNEDSVRARGGEFLALLGFAVRQDMRGGEAYLLQPYDLAKLEESSPYDIANRCAAVFARFPYVESFYIWRRFNPRGARLLLYNRLERPPAWDDVPQSADLYPVVIREDPPNAARLLSGTLSDADTNASFVAVASEYDGVAYQVIAHRLYDDRHRLVAVVGFTVNTEWVRGNYFRELVEQVHRLGGWASMRLEVLDPGGHAVAHAGPPASGQILASRSFPLLFSDNVRAVSGEDPTDKWPVYAARVDIGGDETLTAGRHGATRTLVFLALGTTAALAALLATVRANRAEAALASRQAEFVSAVSHEMKTPLSLITLTGDSLANGRCTTPDSIREYGRLLAAESRQLGLLIDNVLCYARLSDDSGMQRFELIDLTELLCESVERFRLQSDALACSVHMEAVSGSLRVNGDRRMLRHLFDNLIDNALKYGGEAGDIHVCLAIENDHAVVEIRDVGPGIPADELELVFEKFRRGRAIEHKLRGSGLGLTIAKQLAESHKGRIVLRSVEGAGTTVHVELPLA
jgi:signal transduction histidine kinase